MRIRRYIKGHRRGREANRVEREAMRDPFLAEALEGFDRVKDNPIPQIDILRRRIRFRNQRRLDVFKYGGIAASLIFILCFGIYFGFHRSGQSQDIQLEERVEEDLDIAPLAAPASAPIRSEYAENLIPVAKPLAGKDAYQKYLSENKILPTDECKGIEGEVILNFMINSLGEAYDIQIFQSVCPSADNEAVRLIKEGPLWEKAAGRVRYSIQF